MYSLRHHLPGQFWCIDSSDSTATNIGGSDGQDQDQIADEERLNYRILIVLKFLSLYKFLNPYLFHEEYIFVTFIL